MLSIMHKFVFLTLIKLATCVARRGTLRQLAWHGAVRRGVFCAHGKRHLTQGEGISGQHVGRS